MEGQTLKRARTTITRDEAATRSKFWFDDGNVILEAERTQFRVHRSMLSHHSPIFRDMFSIPQPEEQVLIDSCPVIHLADSRLDVEYMVSMLYDGLKIFGTNDRIPFDAAAMMVRLGRKYEIEHFVSEALKRMHAEFPQTLEKWDSAPSGYRYFENESEFSVLFKAINLGHEFSLQTILPSLYTWASQLSNPADILPGVKLKGSEDRIHLRPEAQLNYVIGRERFLRAFPKSLRGLFKPPHNECASCREAKTQFMWKLWGCDQEGFSEADPLSIDIVLGLTDFCDDCTDALENGMRGARSEIWKDLPTFFNLPPWEELEDFKNL